MKNVYRLINWLPVLLTIIPLSLFIIGSGAWGKQQHPLIHSWVSTEIFRDMYFPFALKALPFFSAITYLSLLFQKKLKRIEIIISLVIYFLFIGGFWLFVLAISGLASQGAGH